MLRSQQSKEPARPTRLAKRKRDAGDRFKTRVFYLPEPDLFYTLDYQATPEPYDWVVVTEMDGRDPVLELYDGQHFVATVEIVEFYQLEQSEQWHPRIRRHFTNWSIILALPLWADFIFGLVA